MSKLRQKKLPTTFNGEDATLTILADFTECRFSGDRYTLIVTIDGYALAFADKKYALKQGDVLIIKNGFPFTLKKISDTQNGTFAITIATNRAENYIAHSTTLENFLGQKTAVLSTLSPATKDYLTYLLTTKTHFLTNVTNLLFTAISSVFFDLSKGFSIFDFDKKIEDFAKHLQQTADLNHHVNARIYDIYKDYPCSHTALINAFSALTGNTPIDYIANKRIDFAKELLLNTNLSVKELSEVLAYKSASHFIKVFKQATGTTPLNYKCFFLFCNFKHTIYKLFYILISKFTFFSVGNFTYNRLSYKKPLKLFIQFFKW